MNELSLSGIWTLTSGKIKTTAEIPGDFHSALLKNGLLEDPFYGFNEQKALWIAQKNWTIERKFNYEKTSKTKAILELTEADTFFTVFINGKEAGSGQNQFALHRFDITKYLKNGENLIKIIFDSPEKKAAEIEKTLPYPVPYMKYDVYSPNRNLIRKCQCHGGWDWGPCLAVSGIYGNISIYTVYTGLFNSTKVSYEKTGKNLYKAKIQSVFESFVSDSLQFNFEIKGLDIETKSVQVQKDLVPGKNIINCEITIENPYLWKTSGELKEAGLKENLLYDLTVSVNDQDETELKDCKKICFSTLKVVSEKDNGDGKNPGRSLYFENNGRKIFAKGSNWIPADSLPSRLTKERYDDLLTSAFDGNQNFIRVWGGGIYEKEYFYNVCDRLGLIVWQDFMFACSTYPMTADFIAEVNKELDYQIPRLQHHSCIGIWCGNNENFGALNWFKETRENRDLYLVDYDRLYNGVIKSKVVEHDPTRLYWPSSPCSGPDDLGDNWHCDTMGDMHYWSVWHERKSFDAYLSIKPRFVSEFGYESFPSIQCIKSFATKDQFNFTSKLMEYHQRSPSGNSIILENFSRYFKFPNGFENMIYLSQVQQAIAIRTAVEWWHSLKPYCMGACIWQLNDIWPGPSWSSLEYDGKWKLLHYESKKFFNDISIPLYLKDEKIICNIINDSSCKIKGKLKIQYLNFDGSKFAKPETKTVSLKGNELKELLNCKIDSENKEKYFVYVEFNGVSENGEIIKCDNVLFPALYKHCTLLNPAIGYNLETINGVIQLTLSAKHPAFFVGLDTEVKGTFSTNMFTIIPEHPVTITFTPKDPSITKEEFGKSLKIFDLWKSYN